VRMGQSVEADDGGGPRPFSWVPRGSQRRLRGASYPSGKPLMNWRPSWVLIGSKFSACGCIQSSMVTCFEGRLRAAEYGLAAAIITLWHRSHVPAGLRADGTRGGGVAWRRQLRPGRGASSSVLSSLSSSHASLGLIWQCHRHNGWGHLFSLVRRLSGADRGVESLERTFEWAVLRIRYRHNLR
jgi:hypothetical protein